MDAHTLELLEWDKVRQLVAGYAASSIGKELALQLEPGTDYERLRRDIALVSEMVSSLGAGQSPPLNGFHDVRLVVRRASIGAMLNADQLLQVAETLLVTGHVYRYRMRLDERACGGLIQLLNSVEDLGLVAKSITGSIDGRGNVQDHASPELSAVRAKLSALEERVKERMARLLRDPKLREALRYPNATMNGDHHVLPVSINHRQKVPGVVHRTSSTGETVYIEPAEVAQLSAERAILKSDEDRAVKKVLRRLTADVAKVAKPLAASIDAIGQLDLVAAKGRYSRDYGMSAPDLNREGRMWLRVARHPLLEHLFRNERERLNRPGEHSEIKVRKVVPIDVRLGYAYNMLVVTGPNTGGKTVTLKTMGLVCLMAQAGLHIPAADGSSVPIFNRVLVDIGDEQSLEQSLSTFSSHISRIASILQVADQHSLILLDELGAGTDPTEGAALGRAILDSLDTSRCRAVVTTHLGDLKTYAFGNDRAENAAVEFDIETLRPTYRLLIGQFGMSNALRIARRLKMPRDLIARAHKYLRRKTRKAPELLKLQQVKADAEQARAEALVAKHDAERERESLEKRRADLDRAASEAAALLAARSKLQPNDAVHVTRFDQRGKVVRVDLRKQTAVVSVGLGQWEVPFEEVFPVK